MHLTFEESRYHTKVFESSQAIFLTGFCTALPFKLPHVETCEVQLMALRIFSGFWLCAYLPGSINMHISRCSHSTLSFVVNELFSVPKIGEDRGV